MQGVNVFKEHLNFKEYIKYIHVKKKKSMLFLFKIKSTVIVKYKPILTTVSAIV